MRGLNVSSSDLITFTVFKFKVLLFMLSYNPCHIACALDRLAMSSLDFSKISFVMFHFIFGSLVFNLLRKELATNYSFK